ncbi:MULTISPECIES: metal/formaldehyde-sensitive transcriptional repressor [Pseudomonas]|jgi:DNA-binding FrmR family transcriptional regulator|uniref:Metal/formaldehyde-sensitive transcriptional repressor n=2 Tax=Pseudomonas TaxID=286 RepID=A0A345RSC3_9PSED|nr:MULTISPECIES: metal/formaldehyde-sensitive transcriptional repressor [Pseudomonas]AXI62189.1 metal/formaldehyde-sensitive transcriptional repressor [Pseudomonas kribbensis]QJP96227.1 metal/formaldehyde-sensitive transcriptional repressor [Pseudomonas fluorescens]RIJ11932.1 metal/formaldehyde-sensitive transcriptional repressor [Pseudomonas sp. 91RF]UQS16883.1 metal/formaldehyde-sensitive transcriptional repressor [Pseudomonas sp. HS6]UWI59789.1 metal/formaldehyde-sensitive transcriptional r
MSHTHEHKGELLNRVRRIAGQVQAVERALESEADCAKTLHLMAAIRGAVNGLMEQFIEAHAREHVAHPDLSDEARAQGVEELLQAIRRYSK